MKNGSSAWAGCFAARLVKHKSRRMALQGTFSPRAELPVSLSSSSSPANAPRFDSFAFADMMGVDSGKLVAAEETSEPVANIRSECRLEVDNEGHIRTLFKATLFHATSEETHLVQGATRRPPSGHRPNSDR